MKQVRLQSRPGKEQNRPSRVCVCVCVRGVVFGRAFWGWLVVVPAEQALPSRPRLARLCTLGKRASVQKGVWRFLGGARIGPPSTIILPAKGKVWRARARNAGGPVAAQQPGKKLQQGPLQL